MVAASHSIGKVDAMRTTIDAVGRLVIPKRLRDELGLSSGPVEVVADGAALRIEAVHDDHIEQRNGRPVIPEGGAPVTDEMVTSLRDSGRR